jgi:hypothetical protein
MAFQNSQVPVIHVDEEARQLVPFDRASSKSCIDRCLSPEFRGTDTEFLSCNCLDAVQFELLVP